MSHVVRLAWCLLWLTTLSAHEEAALSKLDFKRDIKPLLAIYCYDCHGNAKAKGEINVERYQDIYSVQKDADIWLEVVQVLDTHDMPPKDHKRQPRYEERSLLSAWITWAIDNVEQSTMTEDPGSVVLHRLNKTEFNNTYRDLLHIDVGLADNFPDDNGGDSGFDNSADTLFTPILLIEKLLSAASAGLAQAPPELLFPKRPDATHNIYEQRKIAKELIEQFLERAWRRPANTGDTERLLKTYDFYMKKKAPWETAVRQAYRQILVSPPFIYRVEEVQVAKHTPYEIGHYDMANRLSYFLWSSMPDDELFALAKAEKLHDAQVIDQQVVRMLNDEKAQSFGYRFAGQWLETNLLRTGGGPDRDKFPQYTDELRASMCAEPGEFFNGLIKNNRSVLDLLDSDYVYVNEDLAKIYDIRGISGNDFQQVARPNKGRGGVLTMPAVMALTSNPQRTSPVLRGAWVLSHILNTPPPPPPPNVPPLEDVKNNEAGKMPQQELSLRARLEQHRSATECASCHNRFDPIGFGLEGYGVLGSERNRDEFGNKIDTSGTLLTGETFTNAEELKAILMQRKDAFARTVVEKLLAYALGRNLEFYDRPTIKKLTAQLIADNYRIQGLLLGIAKCYPMRFKRNGPMRPLRK